MPRGVYERKPKDDLHQGIGQHADLTDQPLGVDPHAEGAGRFRFVCDECGESFYRADCACEACRRGRYGECPQCGRRPA